MRCNKRIDAVSDEILTANKDGTAVQFEIVRAYIGPTFVGKPRCRGGRVGSGHL